MPEPSSNFPFDKTLLVAGSICAGLAVALGAFGAHELKKMVTAEQVATFQTGVQYQMYHGLAILSVAIIYGSISNRWIQRAGIFFIIGIILFSGSLYLLTALKITEQAGLKGIGILTPIGGLFFILGWISLLIGIVQKDNK